MITRNQIFNLCFILVSSFASVSFAQQSKSFIGLENGEEIPASKVRFRSPVFGKIFIEADGAERYSFDEVAYYQNEDGYFEKLAAPGLTEAVFFKREIHGPRISAYSKMESYTSYQSTGAGGMGMPVTHRARLDYYVKDNGFVKKMTFANLKKDLTDSPASVSELKKVKGLRVVTGLLYLAGAGMIIGGISSDLSKKDNDLEKGGGVPPFLIAGAVTLAVPWFIFRPIKRKKMLKSVELYNQ